MLKKFSRSFHTTLLGASFNNQIISLACGLLVVLLGCHSIARTSQGTIAPIQVGVNQANAPSHQLGDVAILVSGLEHRENVLVPALKSLTEHVTNPLLAVSEGVFVAVCSSLKKTSREVIAEFAHVDVFFDFQSKDQFERLQICFEKTVELKGDNFSFFVKARPDMVWLDHINTVFLPDAIMVRSRRIGRARVSSLHVSWPKDACGCSSGCVMIDDQVAVVPKTWSSAYFRTAGFSKPSFQHQEDKILGSSNTVAHEYEGRRIRLHDKLISSCPCVMEKAKIKWPEAKLTVRLASHSVVVLVSPFSFTLAPPLPNKSKWRENGTAIQRQYDSMMCNGSRITASWPGMAPSDEN